MVSGAGGRYPRQQTSACTNIAGGPPWGQVTIAEKRAAFLDAAATMAPKTRLFAETLHYTGCRLSKALALTPERVDLAEGRIILNSLKKRRDDVYRSVPFQASICPASI